MSFETYQFFNWLIFIWCGLGMLFIAVVSIREIFIQLKNTRKPIDRDSGIDIKLE